MPSWFTATVGQYRRSGSPAGWPISCSCGFVYTYSGGREPWMRARAHGHAADHLKVEHGVVLTHRTNRGSALVLTGPDDRLLTGDERERYQQLANKPATLRDTPRTWVLMTVWAAACLGATVLLDRADGVPEPNAADDAYVWLLLVVMFGGIAGVIASAIHEARQKSLMRVTGYLDALRLAERRYEPSRTSVAGDNGGSHRTFPVTGGAYDPDLYRQRGGYGTFARMDALGIDDYETYKNNVEEAE